MRHVGFSSLERGDAFNDTHPGLVEQPGNRERRPNERRS